jgi:hypothetical protein
VPIVLKSGSLNLLEPSGALQACNGITLPFYTFTQIRREIRGIRSRVMCAVVSGHCEVVDGASNMLSYKAACLSQHLTMTLTFRNFTPGTSSYSVCKPLRLFPYDHEELRSLCNRVSSQPDDRRWPPPPPPPVTAAFLISTVSLCVTLGPGYRLCLCSIHTNDAKCNHTNDNTGCLKNYVTNFSCVFPTPTEAKIFLSTWVQK